MGFGSGGRTPAAALRVRLTTFPALLTLAFLQRARANPLRAPPKAVKPPAGWKPRRAGEKFKWTSLVWEADEWVDSVRLGVMITLPCGAALLLPLPPPRRLPPG